MTYHHWKQVGDGHRRGAQVLDNAEGVLMGLRRCEAGEAFHEIVGVARAQGLSVFAVAEALAALARNEDDPVDVPRDAMTVARREWGAIMVDPRAVR